MIFAIRSHLTDEMYEKMRKFCYTLAFCCYNFWLYKGHPQLSLPGPVTFFILKTFFCLINLYPLTDKGKCSVQSIFFFLFSVNTIISFQTLWNTLFAFYLYIVRFFRLENHFYNFGPGDQRAGGIADDSISWLWHPHLTACVSPFPGLNGNLEAIVKTQ